MDQLLAMRVFTRVVDDGTFTKAADSLQLPKSTVTKLVQSLEDHLRVKLLVRSTRRVAVTPEGAAYHARASRVLAEIAELDASMSPAAGPRGTLRVDVGAAMASQILIPALPDFHRRYPDVRVELGVTDRRVNLIGEHVDCVIRSGPLADQSLIARRLGELLFVTCAAPGYLAQRGTPAHPDDIDGRHRLVGYLSPRTGRAVPLSFTRDGQRVEVSARADLAVNESNAHRAATLAGLGIAQLSAFMAAPHLASGALVPILRDWAVDSAVIFAVHSSTRMVSARLRAFLDWIADLFATSVAWPRPPE
jgi:LysR family transcriptional regulator, regulator for bpeEF and oprC